MRIINLYPGSFGSNCYLVEHEGHALIVDPSASAAAILRRLEADGCTPDAILLTHGHFDHIMSIDTLREAVPGLPVCIHASDAPMLTDGDKNAFAFFFRKERTWGAADRLLANGDVITVGSAAFRVIHTPGHSPGSVCYLCESESAMLTGDTLFADSIGRWDLWEGNAVTLRRSLDLLETFDKTLTIYPGHGDTETLGRALAVVPAFF